MKKVLEILNRESYNLYMGLKSREKSAKEIHEHYMKFMEWKDNDSNFQIYDDRNVYIDLNTNKLYSLDGVYEYWSNLSENKEG